MSFDIKLHKFLKTNSEARFSLSHCVTAWLCISVTPGVKRSNFISNEMLHKNIKHSRCQKHVQSIISPAGVPVRLIIQVEKKTSGKRKMCTSMELISFANIRSFQTIAISTHRHCFFHYPVIRFLQKMCLLRKKQVKSAQPQGTARS